MTYKTKQEITEKPTMRLVSIYVGTVLPSSTESKATAKLRFQKLASPQKTLHKNNYLSFKKNFDYSFDRKKHVGRYLFSVHRRSIEIYGVGLSPS